MAEYFNDDESPPQGSYAADDPQYRSLIRSVRSAPMLSMPTQGTAPRRAPTHWGRADRPDPVPGYTPSAYGSVGDMTQQVALRGGYNQPEPEERQLLAQSAPPAAGGALPQTMAAQQRAPRAAPTGAAGQPWHDQATGELIKAADAYTRQPDMTDAVAQYRRRADAASDDIATAMMLQGLGGDEMSPVAGAVLRHAIAARTPQEIPGGWGTISSEGFTANPYKAREAEVARLEARAKFFETRALHADTLEERAYAREIADETRRLAIEAQTAANRQRNEDRDERRGDSQSAANARLEDQMGKAYETQVKDYRTELDATRKVAQLAPTMLGRKPNSIEQQSMIVLLNKFLDPGSVVREGEFDRVVRAMGYLDRAQNLSARILRGELMSDRLIKDIVEMAKFYEKAATTKVNFIGDQYYDKAAKRKLDPTNIVIDPYYTPRELREAPRAGVGTESNPLRAPRPAAPPPGTGNPIIDSRPAADPNAPRRNIVDVNF